MNCTCQKAMLSRDGTLCCRCGGKGIMDLGPVAPGWTRETKVDVGSFQLGDASFVCEYEPLKTTLFIPDLSEENIRRLIDEWAQSGISMPLDMPRLSSFLHKKLTGQE